MPARLGDQRHPRKIREIGIIIRPLDKPGADRICHDVLGGFGYILSSSQNVIKKRNLPKGFSGFCSEMECGFVFEGFYETQEVRG